MYETLFFGKEKINLEKVDSTNTYLKQLLADSKDLIEGLVVITQQQELGRGQRGNYWQSEPNKNITFSLLIRPKISVSDQFMISKTISLGVVDFLIAEGIKNVTIKWPNDIYIENTKIAGILIENVLKGSSIDAVIVGVGLNVNQLWFANLPNATSLRLINGVEFDLEETLNKLLFFIEKRYLILKKLNFFSLDKDYIKHLFRINELHNYEISNGIVQGEIVGVSQSGKLQININGVVQEFDLKEVKMII
ncbi:MAG: biotin--[acetyl-CoA-carboxylase] ligase [Vicingus serpentipes]|nr:biotin--[acetyl-CoA-carboxylase] ligase [Vicingus serpentipes]